VPAKLSKFRPHTLSLPPSHCHPLIAGILCRAHGLLSGDTSVVFMLAPSHVGLAGNLAADIAAKAVLILPVSNLISLLGLSS